MRLLVMPTLVAMVLNVLLCLTGPALAAQLDAAVADSVVGQREVMIHRAAHFHDLGFRAG